MEEQELELWQEKFIDQAPILIDAILWDWMVTRSPLDFPSRERSKAPDSAWEPCPQTPSCF